MRTSAGGAAEFDADSLFETVAGALDDLLAGAGADACRIVAVGTSCFWHSLVGVDAGGLACTPVTTWADGRAGVVVTPLRERSDESAYHRRTGAMWHASYPATRLAWLRADAPERTAGVRTWLSFGDYLHMRLFGGARSGASMASGSGLLDSNACDWDPATLDAVGVDARSLPYIDDSPRSGLAGPFVSRWPAVARIPWFPPVGDGACASIGSGCASSDRLALTLGTSGALRAVVEQPRITIPDGLFAYRIDRRRWVVGGALSEGGGVVRWLCRTLGLELDGETEAAVAAFRPDAHGLTVLPFAAGERSPGWSAGARFTVAGMSLDTSPVAILRATLESIAFRVRLLAERLSEVAPGAADVVGSGGALRASGAWQQIVADALGRRILLPAPDEASSRGAALLALEAAGAVPDLATVETPIETVVEPNPDVAATYARAAARQLALYRAVAGPLSSAPDASGPVTT